MEEISALILSAISATTDEQVKQAEETLDGYGMQLEFVRGLFELISTSENQNLKMFASTYLCVRCQSRFSEIPEDSVSFMLENFPNLLNSIDSTLFDYYKKFAYTLCIKGYIPSLSPETLANFIGFFNDQEHIRQASILFYQLSKASIKFLNQDAEQRPSFIVLMNSHEPLLAILTGCEDLFVKANVMKSLIKLFKANTPDIQKAESTVKEQAKEVMTAYLPAFETLIPLLDSVEDENYSKYFKATAMFFAEINKHLELEDELVGAVCDKIFTHALEMKQNNITKTFIQFFNIYQPNKNQFFDDKVQEICTELLLPLYALTEEKAELAISSPEEFAHDNIYASSKENDIYSQSVLCIKNLYLRHPAFSDFAIQLLNETFDQFASDQNSLNLYTIFHFFSGASKEVFSQKEKINNDSEKTSEIQEKSIEFNVKAAALLESDDVLAVVSYLLLISNFDNLASPVIPVEITHACIELMGSDSKLVQYCACTSVESQLRAIINSAEATAEFIEGFSFDVSQFLETILSIATDFGDPHLNYMIVYCTRIPAFKESIMEYAPGIVDETFDQAEQLAEGSSEDSSNQSFVFNSIMNIIDVVKDQPDALMSITTYCAEKIVEKSHLFDSIFLEELVNLASQITLHNHESHETFYELATTLFDKIPEITSVDTKESICIIIHNLFISNMEICSTHIDWLYQAAQSSREMFEQESIKLLSYSLILSATLTLLPEEAAAQIEEIFQFSIELLSEIDLSEIYDVEDVSELLYTLFTKFPEQTLGAVQEPEEILSSFQLAVRYPIDCIEVSICASQFLEPEQKVGLLTEAFMNASPNSLFTKISVDEYIEDNMLIDTKIIKPKSDSDRLAAVVEFCRGVIESEPELARATGIEKFIYYVDHPAEQGVRVSNPEEECEEEAEAQQ